jgi:hypothetical protein
MEQGMSPVGPQGAESDPKYPVQGRQQRALPFSSKRRDLHSQRYVLDGNGLMSAEEQADESKHEQPKALACLRFFPSIPLPVTRYAWTEYGEPQGPRAESDRSIPVVEIYAKSILVLGQC